MYRGIFSKKSFSWVGFLPNNLFMGTLLGEIHEEGLLYIDELLIRSCQGKGELYKCILQ